jgi:putative salt-induced outer membrane protein YdiY
LLLAPPASAADKMCPCPPPTPPAPHWTGALGGGLSLTGGNSDTSSYNLSLAVKHDPRKAGVFKADGLYLRTESADLITVDRTSLGARYERTHSGGRFFAFGETRFLRDVLNEVDRLIAPQIGVGCHVVNRDGLTFDVDGGVGLALEKLTGLEGTTSAALNVGESLNVKLTRSASLVQVGRGLWKMNDPGDAYYHFEVGVLTSLVARLDLKLGLVADYKTRPPDGNEKHDTGVLAQIAFKI